MSREFPVWLQGGIPITATAVTGNLTVTGQTSAGYVTLSNQSTNAPSTSTLNFPLADNRANGVSVPLTATGTLWAVYKAATGKTADLVFDVTGYYAPGAGGLRSSAQSRSSPGWPAWRQPRATGGLPRQHFSRVGFRWTPRCSRGGRSDHRKPDCDRPDQPGLRVHDPGSQQQPSYLDYQLPGWDNRANGVTLPLSTLTPGNTSLVYKATSTGTTYLLLDITGYFK